LSSFRTEHSNVPSGDEELAAAAMGRAVFKA